MDDNNEEIILNQLNSLPPSKELLQQYQVKKINGVNIFFPQDPPPPPPQKNILNFIFFTH